MDVEAYLERLGLSGVSQPDYEGLARLQRQHLLQIPFENLDVTAGVPIVLDEERLMDKVVRRRRGGFCYELNGAFSWLLRTLGYRVTLLAAEVTRADGGWGIPFDHLTLRVDLDRPYIVDVGFGDSARTPLALEGDEAREPWGDRFRISRVEDFFFVERSNADSPEPIGRGGGAPRQEPESRFDAKYRFTLTPRKLADFAEGCRYHQTSPESPFTQRSLVTRALPEGRVTLLPDKLVVTHRGEKRETPIPDRETWLRSLREHFGPLIE